MTEFVERSVYLGEGSKDDIIVIISIKAHDEEYGSSIRNYRGR